MSFIDRFEDELLTAATRERDRHTARRRRWRLPAIGLGGMAAIGAAAAAILLIPAGGRLSPVEEARAALGAADEIVHFKIDTSVAVEGFDQKVLCKPDEPLEVWQATGGPPRIRFRHPAQVLGDQCGPRVRMPDGTPILGVYQTAFEGNIETTYTPELRRAVRTEYDPDRLPFLNVSLAPDDSGFVAEGKEGQDQQAVLRQLLAAPGLRDLGVSEEGGREIRRFVLPESKFKGDDPDRPKDGTITYVVDARTFAPISVVKRFAMDVSALEQEKGKKKVFRYHLERVVFPLWERLPLDARHEPLLRIQLPPGTSVVSGTTDHWYQSPRPQRVKWEQEGDARLKAYEARQSAK